MYSKFIPIIMIADDNYVMPTCVTATSAIINKNEDTYYEFNIIMAECSDFSREKIQELEHVSLNCCVNIIEVSLDKYRNFNQLEHISVAALLKFDMCDIVSQYDKILYIDGDILVQADLWDLFSVDIGNTYAGAVKEISCVIEDRGIINSGVLLFNAKRIRDEHLSEKFLKKRIELGDRGSMDQQTFNLVFDRDYTYISIRYNCNAGKLIGDNKNDDYTIEGINNLYQEKYDSIQSLLDEAVIIHFTTSNKPWIYTFHPLAKKWYSYYKLSPFKNEEFHLRNKWSYRFFEMLKAFKSQGLSGIVDRVINKLNRLLKKDACEAEPWE